MKNLKGMNSSFSSLENKRLTDLKSVQGGNYAIQSNVNCGEGCAEYDVYSGPNGTGTYLRRDTYTAGGTALTGN